VRLGYGVGVWLCAGHASREFQTRRSGRDFVRTLSGVWKANGCLTAARSRALHAHLASLAGPDTRSRPGSYTWPALRRQLEAAYASGTRPADVADSVRPLCSLARPSSEPPDARALGGSAPLAHAPAADLSSMSTNSQSSPEVWRMCRPVSTKPQRS
jgi:hypothetical protein